MNRAKVAKALLHLAANLTDSDPAIEKKYPKLSKALHEQTSDSMCSWSELAKARNKEMHLAKCAVYFTMAANGPDIPFQRVGKIVSKLKRKGVNILGSYEKDQLYKALAQLGYFGKAADELRDPADKYY